MAATGARKAGGKSRTRSAQNRKGAGGRQAAGRARGDAQMAPSDDTSSRRKPSGAARSAAKAATGRTSARGTKTTTARRQTARSGQDAVQFLKQDHRLVEDLFRQFEEAGDGRTRASVMRRIAQALTVHAQIEEEIFYPAARSELGDHDLLNEAQVEHDSAKQLIAEIEAMRPSEQLYKAKVTVLKEYVKHHVKEEERELFPLVRKTDLDLAAMGEELASRQAELMKQGGTGRRRGASASAKTGGREGTAASRGIHARL